MFLYNISFLTRMSDFYVVFKAYRLEDDVEKRGLTYMLEHLLCRQFYPLTLLSGNTPSISMPFRL